MIFFCPMPPHVLVDFVVFPPGHGRSVTDCWGWDAHETQLRCPDDVSGAIGGCSARRALKSKFYQPTQTMVTAGILLFRENSHGRAGNRTRDLMISSQRLTTRPRGWSYAHMMYNSEVEQPNHVMPQEQVGFNDYRKGHCVFHIQPQQYEKYWLRECHERYIRYCTGLILFWWGGLKRTMIQRIALIPLTLTLLMWRIGCPNNASIWQ